MDGCDASFDQELTAPLSFSFSDLISRLCSSHCNSSFSSSSRRRRRPRSPPHHPCRHQPPPDIASLASLSSLIGRTDPTTPAADQIRPDRCPNLLQIPPLATRFFAFLSFFAAQI
ncbi:hypothetical protein Droror1_Dr00016310 [Drosera rotundifolia]